MIEANSSLQMVFGAGRHGIVYMWDLRGGRAASAFQFHKQVSSGACILTCKLETQFCDVLTFNWNG